VATDATIVLTPDPGRTPGIQSAKAALEGAGPAQAAALNVAVILTYELVVPRNVGYC
jgi:hypothetical protein